MDKPKMVSGDAWAVAFLEALGLPTRNNTRVIIDCERGHRIKVYASYFADTRIWDVQMPSLEVVEIVGKEVPSSDDMPIFNGFLPKDRSCLK